MGAWGRLVATGALALGLLSGGPGRAAAPAPGLNVTDFGARGDGATDSTTAIQKAIDAAADNPTRGRIVFPAGRGCYLISAPLQLRVAGLRLEGESTSVPNQGTCLTAAGFAGPMIYASAPGVAPMPFTDSLVKGQGRALTLSTRTQDTATFVDLEDAAPARLDGLRAFTAELFFRLDGVNPNMPTLWASSGSLGGTDPTHSAFAFDFDDKLHLKARMTVEGRVHTIASEALELHRVYHAALSYDGQLVRLFLGAPGTMSALVGSEPAAGGISQGPYELMPIGGRHGQWPHGGRFTDVPEATVDSLRMSRTARYTAAFKAPAAKLPFDADTLLVENFDRETQDFSVVRTAAGPTWLPKYPPLPGLLLHLEVSHLLLNPGAGIGIWLHGVVLSQFHHLSISGGIFGISGREANFLDSFTDLHVASDEQPYAKAGIALSTNVSITSIRDSSFASWPTAIAIANSGGGVFTNLFVHGKGQILPLIISGSDVHLDGIFCSNEDADAGYKANMRLTGNQSVVITSGDYERYVNDGPAIEVDGGSAITLTGPWFRMHRNAREVIAILSPPKKRILVLNGEVEPEATPWSTSAEHVVTLP